MPGILDRERTIAPPGFNRWLVPPAALCVHLCIGMAYGFSVFWLPLTRAVGVTTLVVCPDSMGLLAIGFVCNLLVRPVEMVSTEAVGPAAASSPPPAEDDPAARVHP